MNIEISRAVQFARHANWQALRHERSAAEYADHHGYRQLALRIRRMAEQERQHRDEMLASARRMERILRRGAVSRIWFSAIGFLVCVTILILR